MEIDNPYSSLDWSTAEQHKFEFHMHPGKNPDWPDEWGPHDMIDLYMDAGYTVICVGEEADVEQPWPWTDLTSLNGNYENRDPTSLGVVALPGTEDNMPEHVGYLFTTLINEDVDRINYSRPRGIRYAIEREDHHVPDACTFLAHPNRYLADASEDWIKYGYEFAKYSLDDGNFGMEVASKGGTHNNETAWDNLLEEFMPHRPIWGIGADDASGENQVRGDMVDIRITTLHLDPGEFDPSDQEGSRVAIRQAMKEGRMTFSEREGWDEDTEDPTTIPTINEITVDDLKITIDADDAETIQWFANGGEEVETGSEITVTEDESPYVRARLSVESDPDVTDITGMTWTQPFGIDDGRDPNRRFAVNASGSGGSATN